MTPKRPNIKAPKPRRLGVGSWWTRGFWYSASKPAAGVYIGPVGLIDEYLDGYVVR